MDKEEALHEFIQGLHIAFNNSLAYQRQHPYFIKSVEEFKRKTDILLGFLNPIKLNITPEALFLDNRYWIKPLVCVELAHILHQRKIKAIELRPGLNNNELADLLSALALSSKEVAESGGLGIILKRAKTEHIAVEELDYSELLSMQGAGESGDIWRYLSEGATEAQSLKELFSGFSESDIVDMLQAQVSSNANPDPLFLNLFSFFSQAAPRGKAISTEGKALLAKRIQSFLSNPDSQSVSPVYRNTLFSLLKDISYRDNFYFDPRELRLNYRFVLLNMLNQKKDSAGIKLILKNLNREWPFIAEDKDYAYIRHLSSVINDKQEEGVDLSEEFARLQDKIAVFLEEGVWVEDTNADLDYLAGLLEKSRKGSQFYLNKMFQEDKISVRGLKLFLKFFPVELDIFYSGVESKQRDLEYLSRVVRVIADLGSNLSLAMLKRIYSFSSELIKAEILKAMQGLSLFDQEFLLAALKEDSKALKEALKVLLRESESGKAGMAVLLRARSPWGSKNKSVLENMAIIEELNLKEGSSYLIPFTKMHLFWHAPLKKKALSILEGLK